MTRPATERPFMFNAIENAPQNWVRASGAQSGRSTSGRRRGLAALGCLGPARTFGGAPLRFGLLLAGGFDLVLGARLRCGLDFPLPVRLRRALSFELLLALGLRGGLRLPLLVARLLALGLDPRLGLGLGAALVIDLLLANRVLALDGLALLLLDVLTAALLFRDQPLASIEIGGLLLLEFLLSHGLGATLLLHHALLRLARHVAPLLLREIAFARHDVRCPGGVRRRYVGR